MTGRPPVPPGVELGTLGSGRVLHHLVPDDRITPGVAEWIDGYGSSSTRVAVCGTKGMVGNYVADIDARAIVHRRRSVCQNCLSLAAERRPTAEHVRRRPTVGRDNPADAKGGAMPASATSRKGGAGGGRKKSASAPSRARSAASPAAATVEKGESGKELLDLLYKGLKEAIGDFEKKPQPSGKSTRLVQEGGKSFATIFPPRPAGVLVKIPKHMMHVEPGLPKGHPFVRKSEKQWGFTTTLKTKKDVEMAVRCFKVVAAAASPDEDQAISRDDG